MVRDAGGIYEVEKGVMTRNGPVSAWMTEMSLMPMRSASATRMNARYGHRLMKMGVRTVLYEAAEMRAMVRTIRKSREA